MNGIFLTASRNLNMEGVLSFLLIRGRAVYYTRQSLEPTRINMTAYQVEAYQQSGHDEG